MLTLESLRDNVLYATHMAMSLHTELHKAQQHIAHLESNNKALMEKVSELDKKLQAPVERAPHRDEYLPVGETSEYELS